MNPTRLNLEAALLASWIDQPAAEQRLTRLAEPERAQVFARFGEHQIRPGTESDLVEIIRRQLAPDRQTEAITRVARVVMKRSGPDGVRKLLDHSNLDDVQAQAVLDALPPDPP